MPTTVLMDVVLIELRFINRFPEGFIRQGVGFFHVRGTSCVDERVLFGPGRHFRKVSGSSVDHLTFLRRTPEPTGVGADIRTDTA